VLPSPVAAFVAKFESWSGISTLFDLSGTTKSGMFKVRAKDAHRSITIIVVVVVVVVI
jgi:hypothetical protein